MTCKINGIGTIKSSLENENILLLKGTRFVLGKERNLVSLCMLDDMEFNIKLGQEHIKIFRGRNLVTNTPNRHDLYFLEVKPLIGLIATILNKKFTLAT